MLDALDLAEVMLVCHSGAGGEVIRYVARDRGTRLARAALVGATGSKIMGTPTIPSARRRR